MLPGTIAALLSLFRLGSTFFNRPPPIPPLARIPASISSTPPVGFGSGGALGALCISDWYPESRAGGSGGGGGAPPEGNGGGGGGRGTPPEGSGGGGGPPPEWNEGGGGGGGGGGWEPVVGNSGDLGPFPVDG